jgi:hypothetical protein
MSAALRTPAEARENATYLPTIATMEPEALVIRKHLSST